MAITIYDIAREANVGIGTVSRVLNNSPKVTEATRKKVLSVAHRLNYQPHAFAQALARKKSNILSAVIPYFTNYFFIQVLQGAQEALISMGYDLIIHGVNSKEQMEEYFSKNLKKGRVDGTLIFSLEVSNEIAEEFAQRKIPLVLVDTYHPACDSIRIDNFEGAKIATQHLVSLGHTSIGMINANVISVPARERLTSFKDTLQHNGLRIADDHIVCSEQAKNDGFSREAGYESMQQMIRTSDALPTALFISSDIQAIGVLDALREHHVRVPHDIAIVSFDDIELAKYFELTTMRQPMHQMGQLAVQRIMERIDDPLKEIRSENYTPSLIVRTTCGAKRNNVSSLN